MSGGFLGRSGIPLGAGLVSFGLLSGGTVDAAFNPLPTICVAASVAALFTATRVVPVTTQARLLTAPMVQIQVNHDLVVTVRCEAIVPRHTELAVRVLADDALECLVHAPYVLTQISPPPYVVRAATAGGALVVVHVERTGLSIEAELVAAGAVVRVDKSEIC